MAILGNIRNKAGNTFVVFVVSFLVVMLLSSDLWRLVSHLVGSSRDQIGTIAGTQVSYNDYRNFYTAVLYRNFERQGKRPTEAERIRLHDDAWHQLVEKMLYDKESQQLGIVVGAGELVDLVQGEHIDAELVAFFKDPETAAFDKQKLLNYLSNLSKSNEQAGWCALEKELARKRAREKLCQLMLKSHFVTSLEAEHREKHSSTFCDVEYLYIPFATVANDLVIPPNNQQLEAYIADHKSRYQASEGRTVQYITFPIEPDEKNIVSFQEELTSLTAEFAATIDGYAFAKQHTDGAFADTSLACAANELPDALAKVRHTLKKGMIVGPFMRAGFHTLYKVIGIKKEQAIYHYEIAVIEKKISISDHVRNSRFRQVHDFAAQVNKLADFKALAVREHLMIQEEVVAPADVSIGSHVAAREVVRWLYNKATIGKVSDVFDLGGAYLLAVMVDRVKKGALTPLHLVFDEVYHKVLNQLKAKIILDKLQQMKSNTLEGIAKQYGPTVVVESVDGLNWLDKNEQRFKKDKAFIGKCFGLTSAIISEPIVGHEGIFIAYIKKKYFKETVCPEAPNEQFQQVEQWMQSYYVNESMEELGGIIDQRYKFE